MPLCLSATCISIHALREEGDSPVQPRRMVGRTFLSTPSARRATLLCGSCWGVLSISIHALREEGDSLPWRSARWRGYFYPRPPRGGRRRRQSSTLPSRHNFYPRPPRGGRRLTSAITAGSTRFLSTPSARRATAVVILAVCRAKFLSTPSARRATLKLNRQLKAKNISIHALREEGDAAGLAGA